MLKSYWRRGGPIIGVGSYSVEGPGNDPKIATYTGSSGRLRDGYIFGTNAVEVEVNPDTGQVKRATKVY